jgi:hypothetical protein
MTAKVASIQPSEGGWTSRRTPATIERVGNVSVKNVGQASACRSDQPVGYTPDISMFPDLG